MGLADTAKDLTVAPSPVLAPDAALLYAAIVQSSDDAIISKTLNGIITSWNKSAERLFGWRDDEIIGRSVLTLIPPERHDEEPGIIARIQRGERIEHYETIRQRKDGSLIDISLTVSPIRDTGGNIIGASKIARDITELKKAREARELLLHEIKHRVKNTLGTVQAIATQTFREAPREERTAFSARLHALADAHDLLTQQNWALVGVRETITRALAPFQQRDRPRFTLKGGDLQINSSMALLLAMIIHELGTNAVKYGALKAEGGKVAVEWGTADGRLKLSWTEAGGPPVVTPTRRGFGTQMIERTLRGEQGAARLDYAVGGLQCSLEIRL